MNTIDQIKKLNQVKDLLNENGWCRGLYTDNQGHYCIWGAVRAVDWQHQDELAVLLKDNIISDSPIGLVEWNDQETRRKRDVIRLINRTVQNLEAKL